MRPTSSRRALLVAPSVALGILLAWAVTGCGARWSDPHEGSTWPLRGAHATVACAACHTGASQLPTDCQGCHEADRPVPHYAGECAQCHDEGGWGTFSHDTFPLAGAHDVDCLACHVNGNIDLDTSCAGCHEADRPTQHFTGSCEGCHLATTWQDASFDHAFFPLDDSHELACATCHTNGTYAGLDANCASCHENARPVPHFSGSCVGCHVPTAWGDAIFVHPASLPLAAAHDLPCEACHAEGTFEGLVPTCSSCHEADRPAAHFDGMDCGGSCHPATAWANGHFDHAFFPLTTSHNVPCATCHTNGTFLGLDSACASCHESDRPNAHFEGQDCALCHKVSTWTFNHQPYFPIPHRGVSACNDCHIGGDVADFSCIDCHTHSQSTANSQHREVSNYHWNSDSCLHCHPTGRGD